jgi:hypothetical protein
MQVDFNLYCRDLNRELAKGMRRARAKQFALPVASRARAIEAV